MCSMAYVYKGIYVRGGDIFGSIKFYNDETYDLITVVRRILYPKAYTLQSGLKI
jgi:hypothetical protein